MSNRKKWARPHTLSVTSDMATGLDAMQPRYMTRSAFIRAIITDGVMAINPVLGDDDMGFNCTGDVMHFTLPVDVMARLDALCRAKQINKASLMRRMIAGAITVGAFDA